MPDITAPPTPPLGGAPVVMPTAPPAVPPVTTTVATVTTTTTPSASAVSWHDSLKFRAYVGGWLTLCIGWAVENLTTHQLGFTSWTWIALATSTLLTVRSIVGDWMSPNVTAPFGIFPPKPADASK